jgi:preprotein translocase subunit Sec61beta
MQLIDDNMAALLMIFSGIAIIIIGFYIKYRLKNKTDFRLAVLVGYIAFIGGIVMYFESQQLWGCITLTPFIIISFSIFFVIAIIFAIQERRDRRKGKL